MTVCEQEPATTGMPAATVTPPASAMPGASRPTHKEVLSCLIELMEATHAKFPCVEIRIVTHHLEYLLFLETRRDERSKL